MLVFQHKSIAGVLLGLYETIFVCVSIGKCYQILILLPTYSFLVVQVQLTFYIYLMSYKLAELLRNIF